jgi:hypothetical protein
MPDPTREPDELASPAHAATPLSLKYGKRTIRVLLSPQGPWFAATDLFAANRHRTNRSALARIAPAHLKLETFPSDAGPVRLTAVSPLGAATIAKVLNPPQDGMLDAWVRREANNLADQHGFPRLELSLLADGTLPVRPRASHANYQQWRDLQRQTPVVYRLEADLDEPALFDEDPSLPPHDPQAGSAAIQAIMDAGRRAIEADPTEGQNT